MIPSQWNPQAWPRLVAANVNPILTRFTTDAAKLDYDGNEGKVLRVNSAGDGVEFASEWTYVELGSDFSTTSTTAVDVTGMAFTPAASTTYEFEAILLCRTASAAEAPRPGLAWPTGGTDGVVRISIPGTSNGMTFTSGNIAAAVLSAATAIADGTNSNLANVQGMFIAGASPSGTVKLQLAAETGGASVTIKAGSFLKYRAI